MGAAGQQLRAAIVAAIQASTAAAAAAGLSLPTWGSTSVPHVFDAGGGSGLGHKNRGRLPFVEVSLEVVPQEWDADQTATMTSNVRIRCHVGGSNQDAAMLQAETILRASMAAIRSPAVNNYLVWGAQNTMQPFVVGPLWHTQDCTFTVEHSLDLATFEQD